MKYRLLAAIASGLFLAIPNIVLPAQAGSNPSATDKISLNKVFPALEGVSLTFSQQQQLRKLGNETINEVVEVLTPAQRVKFNDLLAKGHGMRKSLFASDLSISQKLKLRSMLAPKQQQIEAILTPAQQQQARNNINAQH
jgi:Spy/CpxP family protein refolding chaperone